MIIQKFPSPPVAQLRPPPHLPHHDGADGVIVADRSTGAGDSQITGTMLHAPALQWALAKNSKVADGLNLLSTTAEFTTSGTDVAPMVMPFADGLAFSASGLSLAIKLNEGDHWGAAAAGIKLTGTALSLAENYLFPGSTVLTTAAGALKISGMIVDIAAPERPRPAGSG